MNNLINRKFTLASRPSVCLRLSDFTLVERSDAGAECRRADRQVALHLGRSLLRGRMSDAKSLCRAVEIGGVMVGGVVGEVIPNRITPV